MNLTIILVLAVLLDHWLGEPQKYHPLVFFGRLTDIIEKKLRHPAHSALKQKIFGLIALLLMLLPFTGLVYALGQWEWLKQLLSPIILYFCIAANSLKQHATAVFNALEKDDLSLAQKQVGMIVSRETNNMNAGDVRKASIESVLENGADAVFAPIFWFIIAGPAGVIMYRLSNTLDAMWGYKNQYYLHFGWAAARFDDILNWVPARVTALSYAVLGQTIPAINCWKNQSQLLDSPNAGPVMTSGAGALNLQLGGPAWYHGKLKQKVFFGTQNIAKNQDILKANDLISSTLYLWVIVVGVFGFMTQVV